jgi:hypothetical protein
MTPTTNTTGATNNITPDHIHQKESQHTAATHEETMTVQTHTRPASSKPAKANNNNGTADQDPHKTDDLRTPPLSKVSTSTTHHRSKGVGLAGAGAPITPPTTVRNSNATNNLSEGVSSATASEGTTENEETPSEELTAMAVDATPGNKLGRPENKDNPSIAAAAMTKTIQQKIKDKKKTPTQKKNRRGSFSPATPRAHQRAGRTRPRPGGQQRHAHKHISIRTNNLFCVRLRLPQDSNQSKR